MDEEIKIDIVRNDDQICISPFGRIDTISSEPFKQTILPLIAEKQDMVIDLKNCEYISSSGLRVFLTIRKKMSPDQKLSIINVSEDIMDVFELTGFDQMFDIKKSEEKQLDIKVVFFDIDGTLLSYKTHKVPDSAKEAIKQLRSKGIKCVISTGRDLREMRKLPINDIEFDAYLTLNGNICLDKNEKMFAGNEIDPGEVEILVSIFKAGKIPFVLIGAENRYINFVDDVVIRTQLDTNGTIPDIGEYKGESIYQCLTFANADIKEKLDKMLDNCNITSWHETGLDIIAKTGGKDAGIRKYLEHHNLSRPQAMAFGDSDNDLTMLQYVGTGVAMGNGKDELKKVADYVTTDIDEDGIANALRHFKLID